MPLATLSIPAFTYRPQDVSVRRDKHQRYTMKDIGDLETRIANLEFQSSLNALEKDTAGFEIIGSDGLNRFKSGFLVDNFSGHRVGDTKHPDYRIGIDFEKQELRPSHSSKGVKLTEDTTIDSVRTSNGYKRTGDLITLNYSEVVLAEQRYATRVEKVAPLLTSSWTGQITLDPFGDEWFETEIVPELVIDVEGDFQAVVDSTDGIGTVWGAWQTTWSGTRIETRRVRRGDDTPWFQTREVEVSSSTSQRT